MFRKPQLDSLFAELRQSWQGKPEFEKLVRDAHLGIALDDAGRPLADIDPRVVKLIEKHRPRE